MPRVVVACMLMLVAACSDSSKPSSSSSSSAPPSPADAAKAYEDPGPFPVGVTTLALPAGNKVEVWYPAVGGTTGTVSYDVHDFTPEGIKALLTANIPAAFSYPGARDAEVADGSFPLVLNSHGFSGIRVGSSHLTSHLATWGMVVAAPDHPSRDLPHALTFQTGTAQDSVDDISATLTLMQSENAKAGGLFDGHIDEQHVAIVGHSAGGGTAEAAARQIDAIDGYASLASGTFGGRGGSGSSTTTTTLPAPPDKPTLFVAGANDNVAEFQRVTKPAFDRALPPTRLWVIDKTGHNAFDDFCTFGNGAGIIGVAEASGLGPLLSSPMFSHFKTLGEDGCKPPNVPVQEAWPIIDHVVTSWLRNLFGLDQQPIGLGPEVANEYAVPVRIEERLN
jgi:dienelactone hydrolase